MWGKVLIIDDHDDFRKIVKNHIESHDLGVEIIEASSGELGISIALRERPQIILLDIRLPGINGIEAATKIKMHLPHISIIVLTMFETENFRKLFKSDDVSIYIGKSELYEKLVPEISKILKKG